MRTVLLLTGAVTLLASSGCGGPSAFEQKGGAILVYEVAKEHRDEQVDMNGLVRALRRRLNPAELPDIVVEREGERRVKIIFRGYDAEEVEEMKRMIATTGVLRFRILAEPYRHQRIINLAVEQKGSDVVMRTGSDGKEREAARWVRVDLEETPHDGVRPTRVDVLRDTIRSAAKTDGDGAKVWILWEEYEDLAPTFSDDPNSYDELRYWFSKWLVAQGHADSEGNPAVEVLTITDGFNVTGEDLALVQESFDDRGRPSINFTTNNAGAERLRGLTRTYSPEPNGTSYRMGMVIDDVLLSAPVIQEAISTQGRITGDFTADEVQFIVSVLRGGRLPVALNKTPVSERRIEPPPR